VNPGKGSFGLAAITGPGEDQFPPIVSDNIVNRQTFSLVTRCVFQIAGSKFSVENVKKERAPWFYTCMPKTEILPVDVIWLEEVGMKYVMALPLMQAGEVIGVLLVGTKQTTLDQMCVQLLLSGCPNQEIGWWIHSYL
jgi:hypothetical protein